MKRTLHVTVAVEISASSNPMLAALERIVREDRNYQPWISLGGGGELRGELGSFEVKSLAVVSVRRKRERSAK